MTRRGRRICRQWRHHAATVLTAEEGAAGSARPCGAGSTFLTMAPGPGNEQDLARIVEVEEGQSFRAGNSTGSGGPAL